MESVNNNNFRTNLAEGDVNLSAFRKRNNILVLILFCFTIYLTLFIGFSIFYQPIPLNPAVRAFFSAVCNTQSCLNIFNPIVNTKSITNPNQIFTLSLQTAAKELENVTSFMLSNSDAKSAYKNCSGLLRHGLGQIRGALATMRVNPFVETLSNEERSEMMNRIIKAEDNLKSCLDDLWKLESTAVSEVREKVLLVEMYVSSGDDFLLWYDEVLQKFWSEIAADWINMIFENLAIVCVCGIYLWFIFCFFRVYYNKKMRLVVG